MHNLNQAAILDESVASVLNRLDLNGLSGKRLFVTGGTGFFGLWLLTALKALNPHNEVHVWVLSRDPGRFLSQYPQFRDQSWLHFVTGNVRDFEIPEQKFDLLLHAATETSKSAHNAPAEMLEDIVMGTRQVLRMAERCGVRRILLISSGAVYGPQPLDVMHQPDDSQLACSTLLPSSAYGEGKRVMELMGTLLQQRTGIESVVARCYAFSGPGLPLDGHYAMGNFVRDALFGNEILVQGDGSALRSYLHGADLAVWLLYLLTHGAAGQSYNVGSEESMSIKELALQVRDVLAPHKPVRILKSEEVDMSERQRYVPDTSRAQALGCRQWTSLHDSLRITAKYWRVADEC
jgi:nucleoside-diphosphate-sugar epimerase